MVTLLLLACTGAMPKDTGVPDTGPESDSISDTSSESGQDSGEDSGADTVNESDTTGETDTSPPPTDADGDGHATRDDGGDDCDDHDPTSYPGAEEWCDPVDHDCDGEALAPGVCAKIQEPAPIETTVIRYTDPYFTVAAYRVIGDLDGDGIGEIYVACWDYCGYLQRSYQILQGGIADPPMSIPESNLETWYLVSGDYGGSYAEPAGDVNGDGIEDLAFLIDDGIRGLYVEYGPFSLSGEVHELTDDPDLVYQSEPSDVGTTWGYPYIGGVDFDGDGRSDFAVAPAWGDTEEVQTDIFFGGSVGEEYTRLVGPGADPVKMPDLDGDGLVDLWLRSEDNPVDPGWISGANLRAADGAVSDDMLDGSWDGEYGASGVPAMAHALWRSVGDWNGDGHPEVAAASGVWNPADDLTAEILFFDGGNLGGRHTFEEAIGRLEGTSDCSVTRHCNDEFEVADVDGDGVLDIVSDGWETSTERYLFIYPGSRGIPNPGATYEDDTYRFYSNQEKLYPGDVDADGHDDLLGEFTGLGDVAALRGWAIPWDDPSVW